MDLLFFLLLGTILAVIVFILYSFNKDSVEIIRSNGSFNKHSQFDTDLKSIFTSIESQFIRQHGSRKSFSSCCQLFSIWCRLYHRAIRLSKGSSVRLAMPSPSADAVWHVILLHAPVQWDRFCQRHYGRAISHEPSGSTSVTDDDELTTWILACMHEGINPTSTIIPSLYQEKPLLAKRMSELAQEREKDQAKNKETNRPNPESNGTETISQGSNPGVSIEEWPKSPALWQILLERASHQAQMNNSADYSTSNAFDTPYPSPSSLDVEAPSHSHHHDHDSSHKSHSSWDSSSSASMSSDTSSGCSGASSGSDASSSSSACSGSSSACSGSSSSCSGNS
jgi:hypothetical protein